MAGHTVTPGGRRRAGGVADLQRGAGAGLHLDRPSALPVLRAVGPDRGGDAVRPRGRGRRDVRRAPGWSRPARCSPRTRPCGGWPTWPACRRPPAGSSCPAGRRATSRRWWRPASAGGSSAPARQPVRPLIVGSDGRALLGDLGGEGDGRRGARREAGRAGTGRRAALVGRRRRPRHRRPGPGGRRRGHRGHDQRGRHRRPGRDRRSRRRPSARGSTSMPRTAAPPWPCPASARCSTGSSGPTASWSTPTSGSSPRSTAPRCVYREPSIARATHTQHAEYLDVVTEQPDWNPSDYAYHLSRRARGLPFWFSLATHGTDAYAAARRAAACDLAEDAADLIRKADHLELVVEPGLSIVVFRRLGWARDDYYRWSDRTLDEGLAFVVPTSWRGRNGAALLLREPADHARRRRVDPRSRWHQVCVGGDGAGVRASLTVFVLMEPATYAVHRWLMHGPGRGLHRSHHRLAAGRLEANDLFRRPSPASWDWRC